MPFRRSFPFPATQHDPPHTATGFRNSNPDLLTRHADTGSRLIHAGAHNILSDLIRVPPLTGINDEPQNTLSQEAGKNNSTGVPIEGGNSKSELEEMQKQNTFTRNETQPPTTMEDLPGDILSNMFIGLFAKQLAQMRSVSKYWNSLLSESSFVKSHLHHSMNNNNQILLVFYKEASSSDPHLFTSHPSPTTNLELTRFVKLPPVNPKSGYTRGNIKVIGSVHGLICSSYGDDNIHIWNPSISAVSTLPPHYIPSSGSYEIFLRFGFDPKNEDYKVVKIIGHIGSVLVSEWLQVAVYSMKKGSWDLVSQRIPSHITMLINCDITCVDGHAGLLHWVGYIGESVDRQTIVAFDLSSETFREIPFPDSIRGGDFLKVVGVLGGKLSVLSLNVNEVDRYDVWVMEEYGVLKSWVKHHAFLHFAGDIVPIGFTSHNELVVQYCNNYCLGLYDPASQKIKSLENFCFGNYNLDKVVEYVDSLVWVAPVEHI